MRRERGGTSGPEIIPHPDDIEIDPRTGAVSFNGPLTLDQKMAQDLLVSAWPRVDREMRNSPGFQAKNSSRLRVHAKLKRQAENFIRLVAKRASKTNSWEMATPQERIDYLRRTFWPTISKDVPAEFVQSDCMLKLYLRNWLGIEPTEKEQEALLAQAREACLR